MISNFFHLIFFDPLYNLLIAISAFLSTFSRLKKHMKAIKVASGAILVAMGLLLITNRMTILTSYMISMWENIKGIW